MQVITSNTLDFTEKIAIICLLDDSNGDMKGFSISAKNNVNNMVKADVDNLFNIKPTHVLTKNDQNEFVRSVNVLSNAIAQNTRRGRGNTIFVGTRKQKDYIDKRISGYNIIIDDSLEDNIITIAYIGRHRADRALAYKDGIYYDPNTPHHNWYDYFEVMYLEME